MKNLFVLKSQNLFFLLFSFILSFPAYAADRPIPLTILGYKLLNSCKTGTKSYTVSCGPGTRFVAACVLKNSKLAPDVYFRLQATRRSITSLSPIKVDTTAGDSICDRSNSVSLLKGAGIYYLNAWTNVCGVTSFSGTVSCFDSSNLKTSTVLLK